MVYPLAHEKKDPKLSLRVGKSGLYEGMESPLGDSCGAALVQPRPVQDPYVVEIDIEAPRQDRRHFLQVALGDRHAVQLDDAAEFAGRRLLLFAHQEMGVVLDAHGVAD